MVAATHRVVPPALSYDAIASVLLMLIVNDRNGTGETSSNSTADRYVKIQKLRGLIRVLAVVLGSFFDGRMLLQSLLSFNVDSKTWSRDDEEDKARLIFQCSTLAIGALIHDSGYPDSNREAVATTIRSVLKITLTYCCNEYGPFFRCKGPLQMIDYFHDGFGKRESNSGCTPIWLMTMRCLLFLEPPESTEMKRFFSCGTSNDTVHATSEWEEELPRIKACHQLGGEVHSDLIWILLKSTSLASGIDAEMAIRIVENLLIRCSEKQPIPLTVNDPKIIWELYNLVAFEPKHHDAEGRGWTKLASDEFSQYVCWHIAVIQIFSSLTLFSISKTCLLRVMVACYNDSTSFLRVLTR